MKTATQIILCLVLAQQVFPQDRSDAASQTTVIPDATQLIVTVFNNRGSYIDGLRKDFFRVIVNGESQEVTSLSNEDSPASIGIIFDVSGSVGSGTNPGNRNPEMIGPARQTLAQLFASGNQSNEYFLVGFSDRPELLQDWTADGKVILSKLSDVYGKGNSAVFDASHLGLKKILKGKYAKRALIVVSDGQDNDSRIKFAELRKELIKSGVLLYSMMMDESGGVSQANMGGQAILAELSGVSGGLLFLPKSKKEAQAVFDRIATELRHQYAISFQPKHPVLAEKVHKVKIKVELPPDAPAQLKDLKTRVREGY